MSYRDRERGGRRLIGENGSEMYPVSYYGVQACTAAGAWVGAVFLIAVFVVGVIYLPQIASNTAPMMAPSPVPAPAPPPI